MLRAVTSPHQDREVARDPTEFACPGCRASLRVTADALHCDRCVRDYPRRVDWVDFIPDRQAQLGGIGPALMHLPMFARVYERWWRPGFVRVAGGRSRPSFDEELQWVQQKLAPARGGALLDLSCGPGLFGRRLAQSRLFSRVYGLDHSEAMLHQCVETGGAAAGMELVRGDASYLPFGDGVLAGVHAGAALHLWPSPHEGVSEVARVLRPGGVFVASTFVRPHSAGSQLVADAFSLASRARVFEEAALRNMCAAVGLEAFEPIRRGAFILFSTRRVGT
jgi:SAM-dependent methyltransferase